MTWKVFEVNPPIGWSGDIVAHVEREIQRISDEGWTIHQLLWPGIYIVAFKK